MKKYIVLIMAIMVSMGAYSQTATEILEHIDRNMSSDNQVIESSMTIHGKRNSRTMTSITYTIGSEKSYTEYLSPVREKGTKMLKLTDKLWIYSPSTDRTIQISGHMLRQSVMGSDMSYEDAMDDRKLNEVYDAKVIGEEEIDGQKVIVLELKAKVDDIAYAARKIWVHKEKYVSLKEELYAKSGQLLKQLTVSEIKMFDGRWYPTKMLYKDMLKKGKGTEMSIISIKFNQDIPEYMFTKAVLKQ